MKPPQTTLCYCRSLVSGEKTGNQLDSGCFNDGSGPYAHGLLTLMVAL